MRIMVKIGSSSLSHKETGRFNIKVADDLAYAMCDLKNAGHDVALVTSGAIGVGVSKLGLSHRPQTIKGKQAAAAVGQGELMYLYDKFFSGYNQIVAQILLTRDVLTDDSRKVNVHNTLEALFEYGVIPIINENDTVAVDEVKFGDNDTLSAMVACLIKADVLILLTDTDGLYDKDPNLYSDAKLITKVSKVTGQMLENAGGSVSRVGTGGMQTKLSAAKICLENGIKTIIMNGSNPKKILELENENCICTKFIPEGV